MTNRLKKNKNALYIKGCLGFATILVLVVICIFVVVGYLIYIEKTAYKDHSNELLIVPIVSKGPTEVLVKQNDGNVELNMWVRGPGLGDAKGEVRCTDGLIAFNSDEKPASDRKKGPQKHVWMRSIPVTPSSCVASFTTLDGKGPFELVVTQSQRPSFSR